MVIILVFLSSMGEEGERLIVPLAEDNIDYIEIMRQVDAGELTIVPAD